MFLAVLIALAVSFLLILVRLIIGKTTFDRILAANSIGTIIVLAISVHGFYMGRPEVIDISIVYALINFIGTVAGSLGLFIGFSYTGFVEQVLDHFIHEN